MKHSGSFNRPESKNKPEETFQNPSIEAQIANLADEITYYAHDLDDGLDFNLINETQLLELDLWGRCASFVDQNYSNLKQKRRRSYIIRNLLDLQVADLIKASTDYIITHNFLSSDEVRRHSERIIQNSKSIAESGNELREFLFENLYYHQDVAIPNKRGEAIISKVFDSLTKKPSLLGDTTAKRIEKNGLHRTVCDYVAGMTDRYILEKYDKLTNN